PRCRWPKCRPLSASFLRPRPIGSPRLRPWTPVIGPANVDRGGPPPPYDAPVIGPKDAIREKNHALNRQAEKHNELVEVLLEARLQSIPVIQMTAADFDSLKANESLSQLYTHTLALKVHVDWLKVATENVSLPSEAARDASVRLLRLANLVSMSLTQMNTVVPSPPPPPVLPVVYSAFDDLRYSVEISRCLDVFCHWAKRLMRYIRRMASCPGR
ncbi:uncharacterized protein il11b, partial [Corythoichthys intestinalis]|uniref:uncharacterized protein il11b n=1 Tax=Corythoichthys intestinalis TaxID=161448 RepID=UPI0025A68062